MKNAKVKKSRSLLGIDAKKVLKKPASIDGMTVPKEEPEEEDAEGEQGCDNNICR